MKVQTYRTYKGACRYAQEIATKHPQVQQAVAVPYGFKYAVAVYQAGKCAMAGRRPSRYAQQVA